MIKRVQTNNSLSEVPPIIDFEASGLDMRASYPISVGIATSSDNFYALIKPKPEWAHWCTNAERLHRISPAHLNDRGLEVAEVLARIEQLLPSNRTVYSDNPEWDGFWATRLGLTQINICSVKDLIPPGSRKEFKRVAGTIRAERHFRYHHAMDDAMTLRLAVAHLLADTNSQNNFTKRS